MLRAFSVLMAITIGIQVFTQGVVKLRPQSPGSITGTPAKIIGALCFLYAAVVIAWLIIDPPRGIARFFSGEG